MSAAPRLRPLALRPVSEADRELLFAWANDPETRRRSFATDPIPWSTHCAWFEARLRDAQELFWILLAASGEPLGQLRVAPAEDRRSGIVSVSIAPAWRGRGLAADAISLGTGVALASGRFAFLYAYVRPDNEPSLRTFSRAGYGPPRPVRYRGQDAWLLQFPPESKGDATAAG